MEPEAAVDFDGIAAAVGIASRQIGQAERPLERPRDPLGIASGTAASRTRDFVDPQPQVAADRRNLVVPDPLDGRRELLVVTR